MKSIKPWIGLLLTMSLYNFPFIFTSGIALIFFCIPFRFLLVAYYIWVYWDRNTPKTGGRRINYLRHLRIGKWFCAYFPMKLVKTAELDPLKNYIMGYHPHGFIAFGLQGNFCGEGNDFSKVFPGLKTYVHALNIFFKIPIVREIGLAGGSVDVSRESINFVLSEKCGGNVSILIPGGAREIFYSKPGTDIVCLKERKGFVKLAIQNGASLVPIYTFGETDLFRQPPECILNFQLWLWNNIKIFPCFPLGRGIFQTRFGFLPAKIPVTSVVGAPIDVIKISNPTTEYVDVVHQKYMNALKTLYYEHRDKYGNSNSDIIFI